MTGQEEEVAARLGEGLVSREVAECRDELAAIKTQLPRACRRSDRGERLLETGSRSVTAGDAVIEVETSSLTPAVDCPKQ